MLKKRAASFWLNAMLYTMLQRVSLFVFGVAGYMLLVRGFSTSTNGVWALYITTFSLIEAVKQGLLRNATIKFLGLTAYQNKKDVVQSASLFINILFSLITVSLIFAFSDWVALWLKSPQLSLLLIISSANILLMIPYNHCEIMLQSKFKFEKLFRAAFIRQGCFFGGLLIIYYLLPELFTLVNVLLMQIIALMISLLYLFRKSSELLLRKFVYSPAITMQFFHFGKYTFGTNLFSGISRSFDHFITATALGPFEGKNYVAYYNTVARINNMVDVPSLAAADVLYPKNVEALETEGHQKVKHYFEEVAGSIIAFIFPLSLFVFLFPKFIIYIIAGPDYYPAIAILQLTILFGMVRPLSYQFGSTLDAVGKPDINFIANTLLMLFNFFLTYLFLTLFGGMGAAYAIIIYSVVSFIVMTFLLKKYIDIDAKNIFLVALKRYRQTFSYLKSRITT
jgi:O-antigen/teichoic acid export membrane protein